jgi:hypothetical protein
MKHTGDIAHLMVVEDGLAACVASHVLGIHFVVVASGYSDEREAGTGFIRLAHCSHK